MRYSIFFAIMLILVSGFVAYFGDILGRRMGKRRLSLFGLRPRYTAIVVTTITGMIIAGFALVTLIAVNPPFRRMFEEGEQIIKRNRELVTTNQTLEKRSLDLSARSKLLEKEVKARSLEAESAKKEAQSALKARDAALAARDTAVRAVSRLEKEIRARQAELAQLRKRNDAAEKDLKERVAQLEKLQADLETEQENLKVAQHDLMIAEGHLLTASTKLNDTTRELARAQEDLKIVQADLAAQHETFVELSNRNQALAADKEIEKQARLEFMQQASALRSGELIFRQGEELVRGVIETGKTSFGVRSDLLQLLEQAGTKAKTAGATVGTGKRAVMLIFRQAVNDEKVLIIDDENLCLEMAVTAILGQYEDALVQVVCARNTIAGEQVPVEFKLYLNGLVFRDGRLISSVRLDGGLSEGRLLLAVIDFLRNEVSQAALRAGIIPIANPDPRENLGRDPESQVEALMKLVDDIKATNSRVKLEAYADGDVYAAGPLSMENLRFRIVELN